MQNKLYHSPIRLVACDLDGTLLGPGGTGVDTAREVADFCESRGVEFTIATGRAFGSVEKYIRHLGLSSAVITDGGAVVSALDREPVLERTIDTGMAMAISEDLRALRLPFYFSVGRDIITEWGGPETASYSRSISFDIEVVPSLALLALSPAQIIARVATEDAEELLRRFRSRWSGRASVIRSLPHLIEFQALGVSKASALDYLARATGIGPGQVLAVGDGLNDLDMLAWAGHSACVGNADPEVKAIAGHVSCSFYAEGVMEAVKKTIGDFFHRK